MKNPLFRFNNVEFTVTLPNLNFKALENEALSDNEKLLLSLFTQNPAVIQKGVTETTGLSRATVQRTIKKLADMGRLERSGSKKYGSWIVRY
mgnify:CR=1 FL=1